MVEAHFENIRSVIINEINSATEEIIVAVYWFTNEELFEKLLAKIQSGVDVQIIIHNDYINNRETGLQFQRFIDLGGKFFFSDSYNPMHNKFCVIDKKTLINGSYNWTYYAENRNRENVLVLKEEHLVVSSFREEFERLKTLTEQINKIRLLTKFEVDENNILRSRDYLANDIVYKAYDTNRKEIVETAFEIAPNNIEVQKTAFALNLTKKFRLKHSIGASLINDKYLIIVEKGATIPSSFSSFIVTVKDNQTSCTSTIHFGENPIASKNQCFAKMELTGLPKKPAGEAKMKYHFTIDIFGNLRMEKFSLDNGIRQIIKKKINGLLEEFE